MANCTCDSKLPEREHEHKICVQQTARHAARTSICCKHHFISHHVPVIAAHNHNPAKHSKLAEADTMAALDTISTGSQATVTLPAAGTVQA